MTLLVGLDPSDAGSVDPGEDTAASSSALSALSRSVCLALLGTRSVGRIGIHFGALPAVVPVNYALDGDVVVIAVPVGSVLDLATRDAVVAFESGEGAPGGTGWTVSVTGATRAVTDPAVRRRVLDRLGAACDAGGSGEDTQLITIPTGLVSGRAWPLAGQPSAGERAAGEHAAGREAPAVVETHAGVVFFLGDRAYKLKKPLDLGFVDFRTRGARMVACHREVELNRRLAPDVYLGVADVRGSDGGLCEHLVVMRRLPPERRLAALVRAGAPVGRDLDLLAGTLARFHDQAGGGPDVDRAAGVDATLARWEANGVEMQRFAGGPLDSDVLREVVGRARRYIEGRRTLFEARVSAGRSRDGHGDLLADDIFCLDDGPRVLDCLEFDDLLRFGDVVADVCFLAMDLERLGRPDLAWGFLDRYREAVGDDWPPSLAHHHIAYRAQVRAKVACLRWEQGHAASRAEAVQLLRICADHLRAARVRLVLVGGGPGTGKSTLARGVAPAIDAVLIRSDEVRKELAGGGRYGMSRAGLNEGIYAPEVTDATYGAMLAQAQAHLGLGRSVVLDATWSHERWRRAAADLAAATLSDLVELRCAAPLEVAVNRVERRAAEGGDASEADESVVRAFRGCDQPWTGAAVVDTTRPPSEAVAASLAVIADS